MALAAGLSSKQGEFRLIILKAICLMTKEMVARALFISQCMITLSAISTNRDNVPIVRRLQVSNRQV